MHDHFSPSAVKVINICVLEARLMNHNCVDLEHLLLGLIDQKHRIAAKALKRSRVTLRKTRKEIELYIGCGTGYIAPEIIWTS